MRIGLVPAAAMFAVVAFTAFDAAALPISPVVPAAPSDLLIEVRGGCGIGWHRGPAGGCRPNFWRHPGWGSARCWFRPNGRRVCYW
jgi:hypothetical protein